MPASEREAEAAAITGSHRPHRFAVTAALAAAHAVLFAASFPGLGLWPLAFVAPLPLVWLAIGAASTRRALAVVFVVQTLLWLWMDRWMVAVTALGYPLMSVYMAAYAVLFVWLMRRVTRHPVLGRRPLAFVVPVMWVGLECLRGSLVFNGYPWFFAGHPLIEWPLFVQSADLLGVYLVSFLVVMTGALGVDGLRCTMGTISRLALGCAAVAAIGLLAVNAAYGAWRLGQHGVLMPGPTALAVQTNLPQSNKISWEPPQQARDLAGFVEQTDRAWDEAAAAGAAPDLVIWPETMLPGFGLEPDTMRTLVEGDYFPGDRFSRPAERLADQLGVPLLAGSAAYLGLRPVDLRWEWDAHHNSAYLITGRPPYQRYDKVFLTPFGETMPYISAWPWLEQKLLAVGAAGMQFNLDAADDITRLDLDWTPAGSSSRTLILATPICFEDTVAHLCRQMVHENGAKRADLLVNLSNDGWFGDHDAGRVQHAQAARFRCIENRVPMVRSVNTGMTVAVDSAGRLIGQAGPGRYGTARSSQALWAELPLDSRSTVYGRVGDLWGWVCLAGTVGLGVWTTVGRRWGSRQ
jgi:apolipoprotein N-acyltransferase